MNDPLDSVFTQSAIDKWRIDYAMLRRTMSTSKQRSEARARMRRNRYQAALERTIERQRHTIEAHEKRLSELSEAVDIYNDLHDREGAYPS